MVASNKGPGAAKQPASAAANNLASHKESASAAVMDPAVLNKYQAAAGVANAVLAEMLAKEACWLREGAKVSELCARGDERVREHAASIYKRDESARSKGIAFPTCLSPNSIVCHYSPPGFSSADRSPTDIDSRPSGDYVLRAGDVVKVELGTHVDGYPVLVATTLIIPSSGSGNAASAPESDIHLVNASETLLHLALRLFRIGLNSQDIADKLQQACSDLRVTFVEGVILHKLARFDIDGSELESVVPHPSVGQAPGKYELQAGDVFVLDMAVCPAAVTPKPSTVDVPTVFGKVPNYSNSKLRSKTARTMMATTSPLAFHSRGIPMLGLKEALAAKCIRPFPVMLTPGQQCARSLATVVLSANGPIMLAHPPSTSAVPNERAVKMLRPELQALLSEPVRKTASK